MQIQVDGEVLGLAPVSVKIMPKALNVIVASKNVI
jgi:diacylglycerol kinase family enzyme